MWEQVEYRWLWRTRIFMCICPKARFSQAENIGFRFSNRKIQFKRVLFSTKINDTSLLSKMQSALCQGGRELAMYVSLNHRHVETVRWDFNAFRLFQFFYFMLWQCCAYGVVRFIHKNLWVRVMKRSRFCLSVFPLMQLWTVLSHQNYPF